MRFVTSGLFLLLLLLSSCAENFNGEGEKIFPGIYDVLIKEGLCSSKGDCDAKEYLNGAFGRGVDIKVFGITEDLTREKIKNRVRQDVVRNSVNARVTIYFYKDKRNELPEGRSSGALIEKLEIK